MTWPNGRGSIAGAGWVVIVFLVIIRLIRKRSGRVFQFCRECRWISGRLMCMSVIFKLNGLRFRRAGVM
jgi:hypothetical protein